MIGFVAGAFDLIHPGYIEMFKQAKQNCKVLYVALHEDSSIERPNKQKPVLSLNDRKKILESIKYIDMVYTYKTEFELEKMIEHLNPDVRFLGDDYINKNYTASHLKTKIVFIDRSHGWSTTKLKKEIFLQMKNSGL